MLFHVEVTSSCNIAYQRMPKTSGSLFKTMNGEQENEFIIVVIVASLEHSFLLIDKPCDTEWRSLGQIFSPTFTLLLCSILLIFKSDTERPGWYFGKVLATSYTTVK